MDMKPGRNQLEFELRNTQECRSLRRARKPSPARAWFERMRQVVDEAADQPVVEATVESETSIHPKPQPLPPVWAESP
jgi:hypothetical protein